MRVTAGALRGRIFESPPGHVTHPMGDKVRSALFNILGDISGLTFLDAFAGSGAIGFEAVSRGAQRAQLVELDKTAYTTIKTNIQKLGIDSTVTVVRANIKGWSNRHTDDLFDIVVCDPPYDAVLETLIFQIARQVKPSGILVLSWPSDDRIPRVPNMQMIQHKNYSNARLIFYKNN